MKKFLVTGGGGFVGFAIVKKLLALDLTPVVVGRHRYQHVENLGVEQRTGDIRNFEFLNEAVKGCDCVFHVAALAGIWGNKEDYFSINLTGTNNVIQASQNNGITRLVYTSTPSVVFDSVDLHGAGEETPYSSRFLCHYAESKALAEQQVLVANSNHLKTVALRPHLVWGPGDTNLIPRLVERGRKAVLKQVGNGENLVDISYIDNVVDAHLLAAQNLDDSATAAGKAYFISQGEPVNLWNWINELFEDLKINPVTKKVGFKMAYAAGGLMEIIYLLCGIKSEPLMTRFLAEQLAKSHWFSIAEARRDFGYVPQISTQEGMKRLVKWIKENGL